MQPNFDNTHYFDPIKCMQALESAGVPRQQAEVQTVQLGRVVELVKAQQISQSG